MDIKIITGTICLIFALGLIAFNFAYTKKKNTYRNISEKRGRSLSIFSSLYSKLSTLPLLKELLLGIHKRLEIYAESDEKVIRKRAVMLLLGTILLYGFAVLFFWIFTRDWLLLILFVALLSFIGDTVIEVYIYNMQNKLLRQQIYYLEILRHKYYEQKSVEDANYEACSSLNKRGSFEVYSQAERINDILSSSEVEAELEKYYETAPNKYFKMLAGVIYITKEYGDTKIQGSSVFIRCITYLGSEIKTELFKREKLKYALKSLNIIAISPLFFLKPLRNWASGSFAPLETFYSSKTGIILGISIILISVICYITLRRLQHSESSVRRGFVHKSFEQKVYDTGLGRVIDKLIPREYTIKKINMQNLIKNAMAPLTLYTLYTRRVLIGLGAFIFGIVLFLSLNFYTRYAILNLPGMPQGYLGGKMSSEEYQKLQEIADYDRELILKLGTDLSDDDITKEVTQDKAGDHAETEASVKRIKDKMSKLKNNIFWWWQFILCILFFISGYHSPLIGLKFIARVRRIDMEEEVSQFQTIILMLMHMNRVHVEEILEWMETFSVHFKEPLQKCLSNFSSGPFEALEELKADVSFPSFIGLIENLQLACEDLGVSQAFEELENEMTFNRESRKESNERLVERKKNTGNIIGFLPMYALVVLYLIIPMIVSGMESISAFYQQLSQL